MPLPLARALCPEAYVEHFDPVRDTQALLTLARWCLRFSPLVGLDSELTTARGSSAIQQISSRHYGITIDLTGTDRLHGDITQLSISIHTLFKGRARIAVTPTIGSSWALSRYSPLKTPQVILSRQELPSSLYELPLYALRIDQRCVQLLEDVGIRCIGELLALPRHSMAQRFGKKLLYRLDQALGNTEERFITIDSPCTYTQSRIFEPPLTNRRSVSKAALHLFRAVMLQLQQDKKAAKYFHLTVKDTSGYTITKELSLAAATADTSHISSIIEPILDSLHFYGELRELHIIALQIEDLVTEQHTFSASGDRKPTEREKEEFMNHFCVRIGKDRVTRVRLYESYIPERSFSYESAINSQHDLRISERLTPYNLEERPSILFASPEPISTISMLPDKPPSSIQWRDKRLSIITGIGPERIAPEWWRLHPHNDHFAERDYFKIQDELGRWLWVYRDQSSLEWFLHGLWV